MESYITAMQKIIPKELVVLKRRYSVLKGIRIFGPIGRRGLSDKINISEKLIRTEMDFFKIEGLIKATGTGMILSTGGEQLLDDLRPFIEKVEDLANVEERVKKILQCKDIVIVPGDADLDESSMYEIGHAAAKVLLDKISDNDIIAVTGGSTVQMVVESIAENHIKAQNVTVVPARGSLGNKVTFQANTLAVMLADKIHCQYKQLNIPDNLSQKALESVRQEPEIQRTLDLLIKANVLVYGIGTVDKMAERRRLDGEVVAMLEEKNAAAEALGYYFDSKGDIIHAQRSIGITIDQMTELKYPIAVAGGHSKSDAILSVKNLLTQGCVIMDEGAAKGLIKLFDKIR